MLNADTAVSKEDKYMVILSDGGARMWIDDSGEALSQTYNAADNKIFWNSNEDWEARFENTDKEIRTFLEVWGSGQQGSNIGAYAMTETEKSDVIATGNGVAQPDTVKNDPDYYTTYEAATYYAATSIQEAKDEENIILVAYPYHEDANKKGAYIKSFRDWLGNNGVSKYDCPTNNETEEIFKDIEDKLIQVVDAGSKVVDFMGSGLDNKGNSYDFDFVNDINRMKLTVDGKTLDKIKIDDYTYGFGEELEDGKYEFAISYKENGTTEEPQEHFIWDINVPVTKDKTVQFTYAIHLTNPQISEGTYGEYDECGEHDYGSLYTNNSAVLYPVDSKGNPSNEAQFPKPTVSYIVTGSKDGDWPAPPQDTTIIEIEDPEKPETAEGNPNTGAFVSSAVVGVFGAINF